MKELEIMFSDLTEQIQKQVLDLFNIASPEEMNWDVIPIFLLDNNEPCESEEE